MLKRIDDFLNRITMYRLLLYFLIALVALAVLFSVFGWLPFEPLPLVYSAVVLVGFSWITNKIIARLFGIPANVESVYITALILALIVAPPAAGAYLARLPFLFWVSVLAMSSKYVLNINKKHIFNPAAVAVAITALTISKSADWWIGTPIMFAFVSIGGLLIARKLRRISMFVAFAVTAGIAVLFMSTGSAYDSLRRLIFESPLVFFGSVMLTEPLTMPPTRDGQIAYGILAGWLFSPFTHIGSYYFTPETALLAANVFSYVISPKSRHVFELVKKEEAGLGIYNFTFRPDKRFKFKAGQYMEWTLGHPHTDNRGNRRYFTIASSPTEREIILGVRFYPSPSSYKKKMLSMKPGDTLTAGALAGDFTLPDNKKKKLVFMAGGIGITPFRSMLKYMADKGEKRDVVLMYSNRLVEEIVYDDVLVDASDKVGAKIIATLTDPSKVPDGWTGLTGRFTAEKVRQQIPDYKKRTFYISGSQKMIDGMKAILREAGVPRRKIVTDFFSGLA